MNVSKFTETAINNPCSRATASRFRLSANTIWLKKDPQEVDEKPDYQPVISHMGSYVVEWPFDSWGMGVTSRTSNLLKDLRQKVRRAWAWDMANDHGSPVAEASKYNSCHVKYPDGEKPVNPVPVLQMQYNKVAARMLKVKTPNETAVKMLLLGKHPEKEHISQNNWFHHLSSDEELREQQLPANNVNPSFESTIRSLAFGTVKKENTMKLMANTLGQMKLALDRHTTSMAESMEEHASRNFAPISMECAGVYKSPKEGLAGQLSKLVKLSGQVTEASEVFRRVITFPESAYPLVDMGVDDNWNHRWNRKVGDIDVSKYRTSYLNDLNCYFDGDSPIFTLELTKGFYLKDLNPYSFSYYWVRRNFDTYRQVLSSIGLNLALPMGQSPSEWDYEDMAVPYFLKESDN